MSKRVLPKPGDQVRIPKGAYIRCGRGDRLAKRSQVVTVSHVFPYGLSGAPEVSWAGSGGYWCEAWEWEPVALNGGDAGADGATSTEVGQ